MICNICTIRVVLEFMAMYISAFFGRHSFLKLYIFFIHLSFLKKNFLFLEHIILFCPKHLHLWNDIHPQGSLRVINASHNCCQLHIHEAHESLVLPHAKVEFRSAETTELTVVFIQPVWDDFVLCVTECYRAGSAYHMIG